MKNKQIILDLISLLISAESLRDNRLKMEDKELVGESSLFYYLKVVKELIEEEI